MRNAFFAFLLALCLPLQALAAADNIEVTSPSTYVNDDVLPAISVFMYINNNTDQPDKLLEAKTPIATRATLRALVLDAEGKPVVVPVADLEIPAGGMLPLTPLSARIVLEGISRPMKADTDFTLTLHFKNAGEKRVHVRALSAEQIDQIYTGKYSSINIDDLQYPPILAAQQAQTWSGRLRDRVRGFLRRLAGKDAPFEPKTDNPSN